MLVAMPIENEIDGEVYKFDPCAGEYYEIFAVKINYEKFLTCEFLINTDKTI